MKKFNILVFLMVLPGFAGLLAQTVHETIPASGGEAVGEGGSASYTVGQTFYTEEMGTLYQGIQQAWEIFISTGIEQAEELDITFSAFPNPATDEISLKIDGNFTSDFQVSLYNLEGKLLERKNVTSDNTKIFMGKYNPAVYLLKVTDRNKDISTFKIVKK